MSEATKLMEALKKVSAEPEASLMEALKKASAEPEARQAFYELLMRATVFVPGFRREGQNGASPQISFKQWPQPEGLMAIPFFPDPEDLKKILGEEEPYMPIQAPELFRLTRGTTLVLTGAGGLSKAFKPDEIDTLLSSNLALDPLAAALEKAVKEESAEARTAFYQIFINSRVFVFGEPQAKDGEADSQGLRQMKPEDKFIIATISHPQKPGEKIIPFFSSIDLLQRAARGANLPQQTTFLGFSSLSLLQMAKGMALPLVMNLGPMAYKIFNLEEIDFLLANARRRTYEELQLPAGSQVSLVPPEDYPQELVGALLDFLPGFPDVKAAYLTTMKEDSAESPPALVIGLETEEGADMSKILDKAAPLVLRHAPKGQDIDFTQVRPGEKGLSQMLLARISPFYRRSLPGEAPAGPTAPGEPEAPARDDDTPGIFGRLKRIFRG